MADRNIVFKATQQRNQANLNIVFADNKRRRKPEIQPLHHSQISIESQLSKFLA